MFFRLFLLFTLIPALELWLLMRVGSIIGFFPTIFVIIFTGIVGAWLAKIQGISVISKLNTSVAQGKVPGREMVNAVLIFVGGAMLLTPGFVTDIFGFMLILPGSRDLISVFLLSHFAKKIKTGNMNFTYHSVDNFKKKSEFDDGNVIEADEVIFELSEPNRAGILIPAEQQDNETLLMLAMPVITSR